jgi:ribosome-binding protein aMBF1 (putative translation factor)
MKFYRAKDLLEERYGKEGSPEREKFKAKAYANYYGEIIRHRRKELCMTQENLAEKVGKKRPYISRVENGEDIQLSNFALIANALGLTIELKAS